MVAESFVMVSSARSMAVISRESDHPLPKTCFKDSVWSLQWAR